MPRPLRLMAVLLLQLTLLAASGCSVPRQQGVSIRAPIKGTAILYTRAGCPYCRQARDYLRERQIPVEERDIATNRQARQELTLLYEGKLKGEPPLVPVLLLGERIVVGFDEEELAEALAAWQSQPSQGTGP